MAHFAPPVKIHFHIALILLLLEFPFAQTEAQTAKNFNAQNYPGAWTLTTNSDLTLTARETAVHRQGTEVYSRILRLEPVAVELPPAIRSAAAEIKIRQFIAGYHPPPVPYTSESVAKKSGREKFTCLEFAEDLVRQANASHIPAQVIGIKFAGKWIGHAVAGFPTADGRMLYFDSTPGAGKISHAAHEAQVQIGHPYHRAGGGELAVVGKRPISEIIPVTKLVEFADSLSKSNFSPAKTRLLVIKENRVQAKGIEYAAPGTLQISPAQLKKWDVAADKLLAVQADRRIQLNHAGQIAAAKALAENEKSAANNDAYGQLRMGERYLTGDGVKKNPTLAKAYLQQAADQGDPSAMRELKKIQTNQSIISAVNNS